MAGTNTERGAEGEGVPAGSQPTFSFSGCSCALCFMCDILSPHYRHKSPECTLETFPCSSQIGKDPSQRKTQHTANGKRLQSPLFSCTENTLVLKGIGKKMCMLQACDKVVSPSSAAVVKEQFLQSSQKWSRKVSYLPVWWREFLSFSSVPLLAPGTGVFLPGVLRVCVIALNGSMESLSAGLPLGRSTLRWVCEPSAVAPTLSSCPEMAFSPLGVDLPQSHSQRP